MLFTTSRSSTVEEAVAEDNVVRPDFRQKRSETPAAPAPRSESDPLRNFVRAAAGDTWAGKFKIVAPDGAEGEEAKGDEADIKGFATVLGSFDTQKVLDRLGARNERKIRELHGVVGEYSDEQLHQWLANPRDSDLQKKPNFFHALIDEAKKRFLSEPTSRSPK